MSADSPAPQRQHEGEAATLAAVSSSAESPQHSGKSPRVNRSFGRPAHVLGTPRQRALP
jgi:hypothetical protein